MISTIYLVFEPLEVIAVDLAMNVQDHDPAALVLIATTQEVAVDILQSHARVQLAFVHADPNNFSATALARALSDRGAQLVFTGDAAERNDVGIAVLHRPFSAQTTATVLARVENPQRV